MKKALLGLFVLGFLAACATLQPDYPLPSRHPEELEPGLPRCTACHEEEGTLVYTRFNHTATWEHRRVAVQQETVCTLCHAPSFCNDCHATTVELKPSDRRHTETYREMPHRGDYLSRHRIDARVNPAPCFRCHGNPKSDERCARCHG